MSVKTFVDTNILIYARDAGEPTKQPIAWHWMEVLWRRGTGRLSFQVLEEYYCHVTQKLKPGLPVEAARRDVRALLAWHPVATHPALFDTAWRLMDRFSLSWWDAQIGAAARMAGCDLLLSEKLPEGLDLGGTLIVNPFSKNAREPEADLKIRKTTRTSSRAGQGASRRRRASRAVSTD